MIHHSNQFIPNPIDHLKLIQLDVQINLFHPNQVSIPRVLVVEPFQVQYQHFWQFVNPHDLVRHLVVFARAAVPHVVFGQPLRQAKVFKHIVNRQAMC
jgi:hypothetical protein